MDADEVVVVESDEPRSKRQKLTDFFEKLPSNPQPQEFPCYLRRFQPTDVLRRTARPKRPVGRLKKSTSSDSTYTDSPPPPDENNEIEKGAARGVYRSYSLRQKLEIVAYARKHTEAEASRYYGVSRSTIYGWRNIDKQPIQKVPIVKKGKHLKKGAGRPISYTQEVDEELLTWVLRQRDLQIPVRRQDIQLKATALIAPDHPSFKASNGWVDKFMRRHSLSLR